MRGKKKNIKATEPEIDENADITLKNHETPSKWKWMVFLFGVLLYVNTVNFDYVLDDKLVITANQITKKGFEGVMQHFTHDLMDGFWAEQYGVDVEDLEKNALVVGGRYRPLSVSTYAIEWELFGKNPGISHFINALIYGCIGWVLFSFLQSLFPSSSSKIFKSIPFWVTMLFLAHPVHVEVVANIKGRDELLNLLFGIISLNYLIRYCQTKELKSLILSTVMLFLSFLSKETTIAFILLGPLMIYFFDFGKKKEISQSFIFFLGGGILYLALRFAVIGSPADPIASELMNSPYLLASESERFATIFLTVLIYLKLMIVPHPLTHDYYPFHLPFLQPEDQYSSWSHLGTLSGVLIVILLSMVVIKGWKNRSVYAYAVLFFAGTIILVSNIFFPVGVFINERFLFLPSVGAAIAVAYFLSSANWAQKNKGVSMGILGAVILVFSGLTYNRSLAWETDATLALTDVEVSIGSAKSKMAAADALIQELPGVTNQKEKQRMIKESYDHLSKSLEIYPEYFPPLDLLGKLYFEARDYKESIRLYTYCVERKPNDPKFVENIFIIGNKLVSEGMYQDAYYAYEQVLGYKPNEKRYLIAAAQVSARDLNNPSQGLPHMEKAYRLFPNDVDVAEKMAITYAMLGRFENAVQILEPLKNANPKSSTITKNLGIAYYQMGDQERGTALVNEATELEKQGL